MIFGIGESFSCFSCFELSAEPQRLCEDFLFESITEYKWKDADHAVQKGHTDAEAPAASKSISITTADMHLDTTKGIDRLLHLGTSSTAHPRLI
jgi:hypothetical protein